MRILQARILERAAIPFSRGSSQPKDQTQVYCIAGRFFTIWVTRETQSPPIFHHFLSSIGHQGQKPTQTGSSLRGLLKEDSCISSWSPGPVARLWKVSRIAQSASAHLIEAARPASLCPATSFSSGYRLAFSAHSSIHTSPWWLLLNCDPCSESAGPAGLAFSSLLAQSFNTLIPKSQMGESDLSIFEQLSDPSPIDCEWWFCLSQGLDRAHCLRHAIEEVMSGISNVLNLMQIH